MTNSTVNTPMTETSSNSTDSFFLVGLLQMSIFGVNYLISFPTHCYLVWLMVTGTGSIYSEIFNLNLSVCEIGNALNCLFYIITAFFPSCQPLTQFFLGLFFTGRPLFQCLVCVERYLAVVHPVTFLKYKPLRYRIMCSTPAWMLVLSLCVVYLFLDFIKIGPITAQFLILQCILFLSIQLFCLVAVLRALKQSGPGDGKKEEINYMKRRAFHLILITTVSTSIVYLPFAMTGLYTLLTGHYLLLFWFFGIFCYILGGFVQPVLYLHQNGKLPC